jgi:glycosyltransferase involved in cell wall biosynthesis
MASSFSQESATQPAHRTTIALLLGAIVTVLAIRVAISEPELVNLNFSVTVLQMSLLAAMLAGALVIVRKPGAALMVLVAFVYLNLSEVLVREYRLPSLLQFLVLPVIVSVLLNESGGVRRMLRNPVSCLVLGYTLVLFATTVFARDRELADDRAADNLKSVILFLLVATLAASASRLRRALLAALAAGALLSTLAVIQAITRDFSNEFGGLARIKYAHIYGDRFEPRLAGPLGDPNFFAQVLLILVPVGLALGYEERNRNRKILVFATVALIISGALLTYSRGGAIALGAVLLLSLLSRKPRKRELIIGGVALMVAALAVPRGFIQRLTTIEEMMPGYEAVHPDSSFAKRKLLTAAAWQMFLDNPVLGVGAGNYTVHFEEYADRIGSEAREYDDPAEAHYPHNLYLEVAAETGLLGLAVFAGIILFVFRDLRRSRRFFLASGDPQSAAIATGLGIALIGYLLSSLFLHGHFERYLWLMFAFATALRIRPGFDAAQTQRIAVGDLPTLKLVDPPPLKRKDVQGARTVVAVFLSRFPRITETFILREIVEMERQGQPVLLVPMLREDVDVIHEEARPWMSRALYTPFINADIARANLRQLLHRPFFYFRVLIQLVGGTIASPNFLVRSLALFPKSVFLAERLRRQGVQHIHAHFATHPATMAWIVSRFSGITFSITAHAHDIFVRRAFLRPKLKDASFVRAISRYNAQFLALRYPDECAGKLRIIHCGVDPEVFRTYSPPFEGEETPHIICVASLTRYKGLQVLIEACSRLASRASFRCSIVGDGPMRDQLESEIERRGLNKRVRLLGAMPQHEVAALIRQADLFVLPSVVAPDGQMEGIPVSLMEAMAAGRPVIASRISGIPELVDDGVNGILVKSGDAEALASAIESVLNDADRAIEIGEQGRETVSSDFALRSVVQLLIRHLDEHNPGIEIESLQYLDRRAVGVRETLHRRDSHVMRVMAASGHITHDYILKSQLSRSGESQPRLARARHEYEKLVSLQDRFSSCNGGEFGVPTPLDFVEKTGTLLMRPCVGESLDDLVRDARFSLDLRRRVRLIDSVRRSGSWLRLFQHLTPSEAPARPVMRSLSARAETDLASLERDVLSLRSSLEIRSRVVELSERTRFNAGNLVGHHGDFWPGNVFVSAEKVQVIDFEGSREGHPFEDLAWFLLHLELFFSYPFARSFYAELENAFLNGYADPPRSLQAIIGSDAPELGVAFELCRKTVALNLLARRNHGVLQRSVLLRRIHEAAA